MTRWPLLFLLAFQDFRAEVNLVHVDVEVRQEARLIDGLQIPDFKVTDNGKTQEILHLSHAEEPLDLMLLLDASPSMLPVLQRVAATAREALAQLQEGDRIAVKGFDHPVLLQLTADFSGVENAIQSAIQRGSGSAIQKNLDAAAQYFLRRPKSETNRRRAVLVITDNLGMGRDSRAVPDLWEADAVVSGLIVRAASSAVTWRIMMPQTLVTDTGVNSIAEKTGGDTLSADDAGDGLRRMIQRLRQRYSLHYAMPGAKPREQRKIKVELAGDAAKRYRNVKIRARAGYIVPGN